MNVHNKLLSDEKKYLQAAAQDCKSKIGRLNDQGMPYYDHLSVLANRVRVIVYDNPEFMKYVGGCETAFVVGETSDVYLHADFFEDLLTEDLKFNTNDVEFLLCHELKHQFKKDISKRKSWMDLGISAQNCNIADDVVNNIDLYSSGLFTLSKKMQEMGWGLGEQLGIYQNLSALEIAQALQNKQDENQSQQNSQKPTDMPKNIDEHDISLEDVREALKEAGLEAASDKLGYTENGIPLDSKKIEEQTDRAIRGAIKQIETMTEQLGVSPGNIFGKEAKRLNEQSCFEVGLNLEDVAEEFMSLASGDFQEHPDIAAEHLYHDPTLYGGDFHVWSNGQLPSKGENKVAIICDTSGSMSMGDRLPEMLKTLKGIAASANNLEGVYVVNMDAGIQGIKYYESDELSTTEEFDLSGFGGTDIENGIVETVINIRNEFEDDVVGIMLLSDLEDWAPDYESMTEKIVSNTDLTIPPVHFVASSDSRNITNFAKQVESWASVTVINTNIQLDLRAKP